MAPTARQLQPRRPRSPATEQPPRHPHAPKLRLATRQTPRPPRKRPPPPLHLPHPPPTARARLPQNQNGHNKSDVSPHTLRRTFGSHLLNNGLRLEIVSKLLGHTTTTITEQAYAQLLDDTTSRELLHHLHHTSS